MKKVAIGLALCILSFVALAATSFAQFNLPSLPNGIDPTKDPVILLWVMTDRYHYTTEEIFSPQVSVSDPTGLTGQVCVVRGVNSQDKVCQFVPKFVEEAKGGQFAFHFIEREVGRYHYQAFITSKRGVIKSNTIEIVVSEPPAESHNVRDFKYESLTEDDDPTNTLWFVRYWGDYNEDNLLEWSQPFQMTTPPQLAPRAPRINIVWGAIKKQP